MQKGLGQKRRRLINWHLCFATQRASLCFLMIFWERLICMDVILFSLSYLMARNQAWPFFLEKNNLVCNQTTSNFIHPSSCNGWMDGIFFTFIAWSSLIWFSKWMKIAAYTWPGHGWLVLYNFTPPTWLEPFNKKEKEEFKLLVGEKKHIILRNFSN